jgi:hypothetical protein
MKKAVFLVFLMVVAFLMALHFGLPCFSRAAEIDYSDLNPRCQEYIPILLQEQEYLWPDMENPSIFAAQIDQETCLSQRHKFCWSPIARLKTSREEGYGLGQITRAWAANGKLRFDSLEELRQKHMDALSEWGWKNVSTALFQIRAIILMDYDNFQSVPGKTIFDKYAFMDAAYNGGLGGVLSEIKLCQGTNGCNPEVWFGNVELTSKKAKVAADGYGQGFFHINRQHVKNVIQDRRQRYTDAGIK